MTLQILDLCAGIGGFSLGLESTGHFRTVAFVEIDDFCQQVLAKNWPDVPIYGDIHDITAATFHERIDIITAGFPCQPFSTAGSRRGADDPRFIWPEIARLISEIRPHYVLLENVPGLRSIDGGSVLGRVFGDLAACGYDADWIDLRASDFGAPHLRERIFIVAYLDEFGRGESATLFNSRPNIERELPPQLRQRHKFHARLASGETVGNVTPRRCKVRSAQSGISQVAIGFDASETLVNFETARCPLLQSRRASPQKPLGGGSSPHVADPKTRRYAFGKSKAKQLRHAKRAIACSLSRRNQCIWKSYQPRMGRSIYGLSSGLDRHRFPATQGPLQYPWEPSRTAPPYGTWRKRVAALGNAIIPQKAAWIGTLIAEHDSLRQQQTGVESIEGRGRETT